MITIIYLQFCEVYALKMISIESSDNVSDNYKTIAIICSLVVDHFRNKSGYGETIIQYFGLGLKLKFSHCVIFLKINK